MRMLIETIQEKLTLNEFNVPLNTQGYDVNTNFNNPDIRPNDLDQNIELWLKRIESWGEIKYTFINTKGKSETINKQMFISKLNASNIPEIYSQFNLEIRHIYELDFLKRVQITNSSNIEILKIYVKLKPELKKGLTFWTQLFN